jgi:hypothetical protein
MQRLRQLLVGTAITGVLVGGGTAVAMAQTDSTDATTPTTSADAPADTSTNPPASTTPTQTPMAPAEGTNANCPNM